MGMILTGIVVAVAIAIGVGSYMRAEQQLAWQVYSSSSARVGDPGQNLVGPAWTGESSGEAAETEADGSPT